MDYTYSQIAKMIDHSLLNPTLTTAELEKGCEIALKYEVASVCVMPFGLKRCAELLAGSTVAPSTTIGFPHGGHTTAIKVAEAEQALRDGGIELDMVVNISQVLFDSVAELLCFTTEFVITDRLISLEMMIDLPDIGFNFFYILFRLAAAKNFGYETEHKMSVSGYSPIRRFKGF